MSRWMILLLTAATMLPPILHVRIYSVEGAQAGAVVEQSIRVALSNDGLNFRETKKVIVGDAAAPTVVRLKDGRLLAYFDKWVGEGRRRSVVTGVTESIDHGATWSPWSPVRFTGAIGRLEGFVRGQAMVTENDEIEMVAVARVAPANGNGNNSSRHLLLILRSTDGREFRVSSHVRFDLEPGWRIAAPLMGRIGVHRHVYMDGLSRGDTDTGVCHFMARDKGKLVRAAAPRGNRIAFDGSLLTTEAGGRLYFSREGRILSAVSRSGRDWNLENGARLEKGSTPAVTALKDGTFLMLYVAPKEKNGRAPGEWSAPSPDALAAMDRARAPATNAGSVLAEVLPAMAEAISAGASLPTDETTRAPIQSDVPILSILLDSGELPTNYAWDAAEAEFGFTNQDVEAAAIDDYGFAPKPDFVNRIDYYQWYREQMLSEVTDNAYESYSRFMQHPNDPPGAKPEFPQASGLFSDADYDGPPGPWDPAMHPEWAASEEAYRGLMEQFREATRHEGYATPAEPMNRAEDDPDPLLLEMLLPNLSGHRTMAKVTMENAWKAEGGVASPERMRDAMETILRGANHMSQGGTLIEHLVGIAERNLVHRNAMWALEHEIFDEASLESTLNTLRTHDRGGYDPARFIRGEHAFAMDVTQYLFEPVEPGDAPKIDLERANYVSRFIDGDSNAERRARFAEMTTDDARASVDAFDSYYRELSDQMRVGYPYVRAADLDATTERFLPSTPLTETLVPSLSRAYTLHTRNEASRRATQLAYATHLFKARNGRWPSSLDELPAHDSIGVRTDPYTGVDFGYRLDASGPRIYSLSEDGIDGGGVHSDRWNDQITNDAGSDDYVFYPPQMPKRAK